MNESYEERSEQVDKALEWVNSFPKDDNVEERNFIRRALCYFGYNVDEEQPKWVSDIVNGTQEYVDDHPPLLTDKVPTDADLHFNCYNEYVPPEESESFSKLIDEIWDDEEFPLNPDGSHNAASYVHMAQAMQEIGGMDEFAGKLTDLAGVVDETNDGEKE